MKTSSAPIKPAPSEPKTGLGDFYRAHRTEVLAGGGILVAIVAYWKSKSSSSSATTAAAAASSANGLPIDPATGSPYQAGVGSLAGGSSTGAGTSYSGGSGNGGYGASNNALLNQILGIVTTPGQSSIVTGKGPAVSPSTGTDPVSTSPQVSNGYPPQFLQITPPASQPVTSIISGPPPAGSKNPGQPSSGGAAPSTLALRSAAEATTSANLAKYRAQVAADPTAKNRAAVTALSHRLTAEKAA